jgi:hypothetical protein
MSVYNGERYLREAMESILNQTFEDFEFLVIDDGSTDGSREILASYGDRRIRVLTNDANMGLAASLNKCISDAEGEFIVRQDGDDISMRDRLAVQLAYLESRESVGLLGSACELIDDHGERIRTRRHPSTDAWIRWHMLFDNAFCHTSVIFRRALCSEKRCYYDESCTSSQDYELWTRMIDLTSAANINTPLVKLRLHSGSVTVERGREQERIACAVAAGQVKKHLGLEVTPERAGELRRWFLRPPDSLTVKDLPHCMELMGMFEDFMKNHGKGKEGAKNLRRLWISRMLSRIPLRSAGNPRTWRFLLRAFRIAPGAFPARMLPVMGHQAGWED